MNPDSMELKSFEEEKELKKALAKGFDVLPPKLTRAARRKLASRRSVTVSRTSGGKLSKWAAEKRKNRRAMAKASRRANRS